LNRKRQNIDPLAAMAAANPTTAAAVVAGLDGDDLERALARALALGRGPSQPIPAGDRVARERSGRARGGRQRTLAAGLATAVVLAALLVFAGLLGGSGGSRPEFATAAVRVAEANPRLLVTAPGWEIVRADEFEPDSGELNFSDGQRRFDVHWYPAYLYEEMLRDRANVSRPEHGMLLGRDATTVTYSHQEYATMLPPQGRVFVEVRGRLGSKQAYEEILRSLRAVDVDTWLDAMPPSTVRANARAGVVQGMLRGIPLPPGFDAAALQSESAIDDRSTLATKVGNAVACGWAQSWIDARAAADRVAALGAITALASWRTWPIVRETKIPWFSNYALAVRQMRAGGLDRGYAGYLTEADGATFGIGPAWKLTLGCEGTYRREVDRVPSAP
jgi:hypothetical protein